MQFLARFVNVSSRWAVTYVLNFIMHNLFHPFSPLKVVNCIPPLRKKIIQLWVYQPTFITMQQLVIPSKQTAVSQYFWRTPDAFPDVRSRCRYIAANLKDTSHIFAQTHVEVALVDVEYDNSSLVNTREMIRAFKRSGNESLLSSAGCRPLRRKFATLGFLTKQMIMKACLKAFLHSL